MIELFLDNLSLVLDADGGGKQVRDAILHLAVRGRLVAQDLSDQAPVPPTPSRRYRPEEAWHVPWADADTPCNWTLLPLDAMGQWASGGTPSRKNSAYYGDGYPWLKISDLNYGQVTRVEESITEEGLNNSTARVIPRDAVLIAMYGSIGKCGLTSVECTSNQAIAHCICDPELVGPKFMLLEARAMEATLLNLGRGGAQANINQVILRHACIPLPPLAEQQRIVAKVDELMAHAAVLEERHLAASSARVKFRDAALHALAEAEDHEAVDAAWQRIEEHFDDLFTEPEGVAPLRQAILQLAVRGRLVAQDADDREASELVEAGMASRLKEAGGRYSRATTELPPTPICERMGRLLPKSWEVVPLGNIVTVVRGITFPGSAKSREQAQDNVACLRTANVQESVEWDDLIYVPKTYVKSASAYVRAGDVLMSTANSRELVGKVALVFELPVESAFGGFVAALRPHGVLPEFLMAVLRTRQAREILIGSATQTTNIANISMGRLRPFPLPVPPLAEQRRIVAKVDELMAICDMLESSLDRARTCRERFAASISHALTSDSVAHGAMDVELVT